MNNTINAINSPSFNSRYIKFKNPENVPEKVYDAIYKSDAIDAFLHAQKPKTLLGKIISLFQKDEMLEVSYVETKEVLPKKLISEERRKDPYAKACNLLFKFFGRKVTKTLPLSTEQSGIKRQAGSIAKPGEHYAYKPPIITAEDKLVKEIENIKDFESLLK